MWGAGLMANDKVIVVAGATGDLGLRVVKSLQKNGAQIRAIVRQQSSSAKVTELQALGAEVVQADLLDSEEARQACSGATCVVSVLSGRRDVIIDRQKVLLDGAIKAGVPRFIPSDYSMDYQKIPRGQNRNLDLRREFRAHLDKTAIAGTSILNGCFTDMLSGQAPFILFKIHRVLSWSDPDQLLDFTTMDDTAAFTALAALDSSTPDYLRVAGDQVSAKDLARIMSELSGKKYDVLQPGGLALLKSLIVTLRALTPDKGQIYPVWQGMQYFYGMYSGAGKLDPALLDNGRYADLSWTDVKTVLAAI